MFTYNKALAGGSNFSISPLGEFTPGRSGQIIALVDGSQVSLRRSTAEHALAALQALGASEVLYDVKDKAAQGRTDKGLGSFSVEVA